MGLLGGLRSPRIDGAKSARQMIERGQPPKKTAKKNINA